MHLELQNSMWSWCISFHHRFFYGRDPAVSNILALQGISLAFVPLFPDWSRVSFPMIPAVYCLNPNIYKDKKHYNTDQWGICNICN